MFLPNAPFFENTSLYKEDFTNKWKGLKRMGSQKPSFPIAKQMDNETLTKLKENVDLPMNLFVKSTNPTYIDPFVDLIDQSRCVKCTHSKWLPSKLETVPEIEDKNLNTCGKPCRRNELVLTQFGSKQVKYKASVPGPKQGYLIERLDLPEIVNNKYDKNEISFKNYAISRCCRRKSVDILTNEEKRKVEEEIKNTDFGTFPVGYAGYQPETPPKLHLKRTTNLEREECFPWTK